MTVAAFCQYLLISISSVDSNTEILTVLGNFLFGHLLIRTMFYRLQILQKKTKVRKESNFMQFQMFS